MKQVTVLKIGGELLETSDDTLRLVSRIADLAARGRIVVVHGGGRELSAELTRRGATPRMIDGIRVTDAEALDAAVSVLAGTINTRLVAALTAAGVRAVGLTGVDGETLLCSPAPPVRAASGAQVDLGAVGVPLESSRVALIETLCDTRWVPVIASVGTTDEGHLMNVNADVAAAHLAVRLGADRLIVLGATDGVLDPSGRTLPELSAADARRLIDSGAARDGMRAKLAACTRASAAGVIDVRILNGRGLDLSGGTRVIASPPM